MAGKSTSMRSTAPPYFDGATIDDALQAAKAAAVTKSDVESLWPTPDYLALLAQGVPTDVVDYIRGVRDSIPIPPSGFNAMSCWRRGVIELREIANDLLTYYPDFAAIDTKGPMNIRERMASHGISVIRELTYQSSLLSGSLPYGFTDRCRRQRYLYSVCGHHVDLSDWALIGTGGYGGYSIATGCEQAYAVRQRNRILGDVRDRNESWAITKSKAASNFAEGPHKLLVASNGNRQGNPNTKDGRLRLCVYDWGDGRPKPNRVGLRVKASTLDLYAFDSSEHASAWLEKNTADAVDRLQRVVWSKRRHAFPTGTSVFDLRVSSPSIQQSEFEAEFLPAHVRFGTRYTKLEKQAHLAAATDALRMLAEILNVHPSRLLLHGIIGLAFGADSRPPRPTSIFAHYDWRSRTIHLTRKNGIGALAHEWWHAFDHHLNLISKHPRNDQHSDVYDWGGDSHIASGERRRSPDANHPMEKLAAFAYDSPFARRCEAFDKVLYDNKYLDRRLIATCCESTARMFEAWVIHRAISMGMECHPYLCQLYSEDEWQHDCDVLAVDSETEDVTTFLQRPTYPYPKRDEIAQYDQVIDELIDLAGLREHTMKQPNHDEEHDIFKDELLELLDDPFY